MRIIIYFILGSFLPFSSCEGKNKDLGKNTMPISVNVLPKIEEVTVQDTANPIKEFEEKTCCK